VQLLVTEVEQLQVILSVLQMPLAIVVLLQALPLSQADEQVPSSQF
jgi:hypothetical protein